MSNLEKKETKLKEKSTRVRRNRLQRKGRMYIDPKHLEEDFHYRVVNQKPGEVERRIEQGYEVVQNKDTEIGEGVTSSSNLGSVVTVTVDERGTKGVLMRMSNDVYKECLEELDEMNADVDNAILQKAGINRKDVYGSVTKEDKL